MKVHFLGNIINLVGTHLKVGDNFPDFRLTDINFNKFKLKDTKGKRLFLTIPSILTDVCSSEITKFSTYLENKGISCYVISLDLPFTLADFSDKFKNIKFLSDVKYANFGRTTGTLVKEMGILTRSAFLVNDSGVIEYVDYLNEISDEPNYEEILNLL